MYARYYISSFGYISHTFFLETFILNHIKMYSDRKASPILYVPPFSNLVFWGGDILITPVWGFVNQTSFFYTFKSSIIAVMRKMYQYTQCRWAKTQSYPSHVIFWIENHDLYSLSCQEASFWKGKKNHTLIKSHI